MALVLPMSVREFPRGQQGGLAHELRRVPGAARFTRRRCVSCYSKLRGSSDAKVARIKARKVTTYCAACHKQPYLCVPCFTADHVGLGKVAAEPEDPLS